MSDQPTFRRDPLFAHDPWLGPVPPAPIEAHLSIAAGASLAGEDATRDHIGDLDTGLAGYGSYVDNYQGFDQLVARFGTQHVWKGLPWGYTSAGNMQALIDAAGGRPFIRQSAHYGSGPHLCGPSTCGYPQAHVTQWDDKGPRGQNVDRWVLASLFGNSAPILISYTIFGNAAICADVEPGAMHPSDFAHWYDHVAVRTPSPGPTPHPGGVANAGIGYNIGSRHWSIRSEPGHVTFRDMPRIARAELEFNEHTGAWAIKGLPFQ